MIKPKRGLVDCQNGHKVEDAHRNNWLVGGVGTIRGKKEPYFKNKQLSFILGGFFSNFHQSWVKLIYISHRNRVSSEQPEILQC